MICFLVQCGWSRNEVLFDMNVVEIQTAMIYATKQKLREMQYLTGAITGSIAMLFAKKGSNEKGIFDRLSKEIENLDEMLEGQSQEQKPRYAPGLGKKMLGFFSKMMSVEMIEVPRGASTEQVLSEKKGIEVTHGMPSTLFGCDTNL